MSVDNPYYFCNDKSPKTPDSSSKGFSFFKRRNSKGSSSSCNKPTTSPKGKNFNSGTLKSDVSILGSPRGSLGSLASSPVSLCSSNFEGHSNSFNSASLRRPAFVQYRERLGSYNESISYHESDDVFFQTPRNQMSRTFPDKYNTTNGIRRHSAGNFSNRERGSTCGPISDEVPKMIAPKPPAVLSSSSSLKYRSDRKRDNCQNTNNTNMDDILIVTAKHSERAMLWANFLKTRFDKVTKQRSRKPFNFLHIKIDDGNLTPELIQTCLTTPLQIIIVCPAMMALSHSVLNNRLAAILNVEKVLGILVEVPVRKILETHKEAFPSFRKWRRCEVTTNDQSLIGNILGIATDILGKALCQRPPCLEINASLTRGSTNCEAFTIVPRKVKVGQNKVLALLNDPINKDDWVKITIVKSDEIIDVKSFKRRNPYTLQFSIPETCMEISTMIEIRIEKNDKDLGCRPVKCESRLRELEQLLRSQDSPLEFMCNSLGISSTERDSLDQHLLQCFQKNVPRNFHLLNGPMEKKNHITSLKDRNPEEYPTLLHFAAKWGFERLAFQLLECPGGDAACEIQNYSEKTPAEIAEQGGFHKLAASMKNFMQMEELSTIYHRCINFTPQNKIVLESKESSKVANESDKAISQSESRMTQAEYMEMHSSSSSETEASAPMTFAVENLNYINIDSNDDCNLQSSDGRTKKMDQSKIIEGPELLSNELRINEPPYYESKDSNKTDKFSMECLNVLENCNNPSGQPYYILQPSNIPVVPNPLSLNDSSHYLMNPSNRPVDFGNYLNDSFTSPIMMRGNENDSHLKFVFEKKRSESTRPLNGTLKRTGSDVSKGNAEDELAEIMYDFKNNVLSIREVEQLVEKWKNRNDVKQSFKEKQDEIEKMREEYDRIQDQLKDRLKRPTPFERVKKLFIRRKTKKQNSEDNDDMKSSITSFQSSSQRPTSSLSLQSLSSLSSSGRLSTGSACSGASLGDSGTHSDHEDRRQIYAASCRLGMPGSLMENYMIPPAPRPVLSPATPPTPTSTPAGDKDRLVFINTSRAITPTSPSEHYILFPSNIPLYPNDNHANELSPLSPFGGALNTIVEAKETPTDSVGGTVQPIKVQNNDTNAYSQIPQRKNETNCTSFKSTSPTLLQSPVKPVCGDRSIENTKLETNQLYQNLSDPLSQTLNTTTDKGYIIAHETNETHNYINV